MAILKDSIISNSYTSLNIPSGTTNQRPTSKINGMIRHNSDYDVIEYVSEGQWKPMSFINGLVYTWYDTDGYFTANGHVSNVWNFNNYQDTSLSGVNPGGSGFFYGSINWGSGSQNGAGGVAGPKPHYLPADRFSWVVEGYIYSPESGTYHFGADGDDSLEVRVNGQVCSSRYTSGGFAGSWFSGPTIVLEEEKYYTFSARMNEGTGGDGMQVGWRKPSDSSIAIIPPEFFFRKIY